MMIHHSIGTVVCGAPYRQTSKTTWMWDPSRGVHAFLSLWDQSAATSGSLWPYCTDRGNQSTRQHPMCVGVALAVTIGTHGHLLTVVMSGVSNITSRTDGGLSFKTPG